MLAYAIFVSLQTSATEEASQVSVTLLVDSEEFIQHMGSENRGDFIVLASYKALFQEIGTPRMQHTSFDRALRMMQKDKPYCIPFKLKTKQRMDKYQFSYPTDLSLPHRLYQRASAKPPDKSLLSNKIIIHSLSKMIEAHGSLLIIKHRSYGPYFDREITNISADKVYVLSGIDPYTSIEEMLINGRAEFAILYPSVAKILSKKVPLRGYHAEGTASFIAGHIMCNYHPSSTRFLETVNTALISSYKNGRFSNIHQDFIDKEDRPNLDAFITSFTDSHK